MFVSSHYAFDHRPVYHISAVTAPTIPRGAAWLCSGWGTPPHTIFRLQNYIVNLLLLMSRQITCCTERGLWLLLTVSVSCAQGEGKEKKTPRQNLCELYIEKWHLSFLIKRLPGLSSTYALHASALNCFAWYLVQTKCSG